MAVSVETCSDCGSEIDVGTVQVVRNGKLGWYRSYRCGACGSAIEEDGIGAPKEVREQLIASDGAWMLVLDLAENRAKGISVARRDLDLSMDDVRNLRTIDPLCVGYGTRTEMEWLQESLSSLEIATSIREAPAMQLHAIGDG